jgi:hypothetical protein
MHLVDVFVLSLLLHRGLCQVRLIRAHIVVLNGCGHRRDPGIDLVRIITRTIPGQQELQYEGRDVCALLEPLHQILADTASVEGIKQLLGK